LIQISEPLLGKTLSAYFTQRPKSHTLSLAEWLKIMTASASPIVIGEAEVYVIYAPNGLWVLTHAFLKNIIEILSN
jgi:hypothetical protein